MQLTYETWLTLQDSDTIAAGMGLPPLSGAGSEVLIEGHRIGRAAADASRAVDEVREHIKASMAEMVSSTTAADRDAMANAVGLGRSTWLTPSAVFESETPGGALIPFMQRVAYRTAVTKLALTAGSSDTTVPIMSEDTVGMMSVALAAPPEGVDIKIGDILSNPRGRHEMEGSLLVNGHRVNWLYCAPFAVCTTPPVKIAAIIDANGTDTEAAVGLVQWVNVQVDLLAHGAVAAALFVERAQAPVAA